MLFRFSVAFSPVRMVLRDPFQEIDARGYSESRLHESYGRVCISGMVIVGIIIGDIWWCLGGDGMRPWRYHQVRAY